jgi:drug/metabolite transporter (DMT)-like permease
MARGRSLRAARCYWAAPNLYRLCHGGAAGLLLISGRTRAELFLLSCTLIWGATFVITKNSLDDASPMLFIAIRFGIASALFLAIFFSTLIKMNWPAVLKGGMLGLLLFAGFVPQTLGLRYTSASKSGFFTGMLVVFTPLFQLLIERRPPKTGNLVGLILVSIGLYFLTSPAGSQFNLGDGLTLACAVVFALYIVYLDVFSKKHNVTQLAFLQMVVTATLAALGGLLFEEWHFEFKAHLALALAYLSIMATVVTLYLQTAYQKQTTPTRAAIIFSLEPVFSAVFAYFVDHEALGGLGIVGGALIVIGLIISELSDVIFRSASES